MEGQGSVDITMWWKLAAFSIAYQISMSCNDGATSRTVGCRFSQLIRVPKSLGSSLCRPASCRPFPSSVSRSIELSVQVSLTRKPEVLGNELLLSRETC